MREIKFRAWDKEEEMMLNDVSLQNETWDMMNELFSNEDSLSFTQYTGLKDKNGVEIYEGDALRDSESIVIVKFVDGEFSVDYRTMGGKWRNYGSLFDYLKDYEGEVIGNVYQNKDLLERETE